MAIGQEYTLEECILGDVTERISKEKGTKFRIGKFLFLGGTVESMNDELWKDANFGDRGNLVFKLEPRSNGNFIEMKAVWVRFEVTKRAGQSNGAKQAAPVAPRVAVSA